MDIECDPFGLLQIELRQSLRELWREQGFINVNVLEYARIPRCNGVPASAYSGKRDGCQWGDVNGVDEAFDEQLGRKKGDETGKGHGGCPAVMGI